MDLIISSVHIDPFKVYFENCVLYCNYAILYCDYALHVNIDKKKN